MERRVPPNGNARNKVQSKLRVCGYQRSHCGYCNLDNESISFGVLAKTLLVDDYLRMMHRGWRRSGSYLYKPTNFASCCACYTIRLRVEGFQISKSQKKVLKILDRFLNKGGGVEKQGMIVETKSNGNGSGEEMSEVGTKESVKDAGKAKTSGTARFTIQTVDAEATVERFNLYKKYQVAVHKDKPEDVTMSGFSRFLVDSPLVSEERTDEKTGKTVSLGCKHQLYRIDGRLVAVGVIDLLPDGLSSVYTFYDPDDRDLVLGKLTALKEIEYTREAGLQYYYMGFYIHDCQKMRYKAEYKPSELLCGTSLEWFPYAACKPLMDQDQEGSGFSVYTPFHPTFLQQRAELGLSSDEKRVIKLKTELAGTNATKKEEKEGKGRGSGGALADSGGNDAKEAQHMESKELVTDTEDMAVVHNGSNDDDGASEVSDDEDISSGLMQHSLQPLAPHFPNSSPSMVEQVPFSIGSYEGLLLRHLNPSAADARKIIEGYLRDMIQNCGASFCSDINLSFN
jgi:arginine-tRNA-protein transferase